MEVLDRYLHAVRYWLPVPEQDDIVRELSDDLSSQIEDLEAAAGRPLTQAEVEALLRKRGHPIWVAEGYLPPRQLIGPALLPVFRKVVKAWLGCLAALFAGFYVVFGFVVETPLRPELGHVSFWLWFLVLYAFASVGFLTTLFAWIERTQVRARATDAWDPGDPTALPGLAAFGDKATERLTETLTRRVTAAGDFAGGVIFTLWWAGVLRPDPVPELGLRLAPIWAPLFWPIAVIAASGVVISALVFIKVDRPRRLTLLTLVRNLAGLAVVALLLLSGRLVEVTLPGAPPDAAALVGRWANVSVAVVVAVIGALFLAGTVRDARVLRRARPLGVKPLSAMS
jgi:hypothetical protein